MKHNLSEISVVQTAAVLAVVYFLISALFFVPFGLIALVVPRFANEFGGLGMILVLPFLYAIFGFIGIAIFAWVYNLVARRMGGVEVTWYASERPAEPSAL